MQNKNQLHQNGVEDVRHLVTLSDVLKIYFDFIYFELNWLKFKAKANIPHFLWSEVKCEKSVLSSRLDAQLWVWSVTDRGGFGLLEISTFRWPSLPGELEKLKTRNCSVLEYQKNMGEDSPKLCDLPLRCNHSHCGCQGTLVKVLMEQTAGSW